MSRGLSQASQLVALADKLEFWHTPDCEPFVTIPVRDHLENWPIRSRIFRHWLARQFYLQEQKAAYAQALASALGVLEGRALHEGERHPVFTRIGRLPDDGHLYMDLGNEDWKVVEINCLGWKVIEGGVAPVRFRRAPGMQPLPAPERGGSVLELRRLINVATEQDFILLVSWLLGALRGEGPYPVLCLHGEQGSSKSTLARMLRALIDPNSAAIRAEPREARDLAISAKNGWVIALDNLSHLRAWLSDALCRLSTGGGFATRTLYTDDEESIFEGQRPVILNGINEVATRGDLLDRAVVLTLPRISDDGRQPESELWAQFEDARPRILCSLLDAVALALLDERHVRLERSPRMADWARWVIAAEPRLPWKRGEFLLACHQNRRQANDVALEASPVAVEVQRLVQKIGPWEGTASELLAELEESVVEKTRRLDAWPKTARSLSATLRRIAPNLRAGGMAVELLQTPGRSSRKLIRLAESSDASDASDAADSEAPRSETDASQEPESASQTGPGNGSGVARVAGVADLPPISNAMEPLEEGEL